MNTKNYEAQYTELIDQAFKDFADSHWTHGNPDAQLLAEQLSGVKPMMHNRESFEAEARRNPVFAEQFGLAFETRDLTWEETVQWVMKYTDVELENLYIVEEAAKDTTPKKLTTLTYKNQTAATYE